jgi:hypothetical protein
MSLASDTGGERKKILWGGLFLIGGEFHFPRDACSQPLSMSIMNFNLE